MALVTNLRPLNKGQSLIGEQYRHNYNWNLSQVVTGVEVPPDGPLMLERHGGKILLWIEQNGGNVGVTGTAAGGTVNVTGDGTWTQYNDPVLRHIGPGRAGTSFAGVVDGGGGTRLVIHPIWIDMKGHIGTMPGTTTIDIPTSGTHAIYVVPTSFTVACTGSTFTVTVTGTQAVYGP